MSFLPAIAFRSSNKKEKIAIPKLDYFSLAEAIIEHNWTNPDGSYKLLYDQQTKVLYQINKNTNHWSVANPKLIESKGRNSYINNLRLEATDIRNTVNVVEILRSVSDINRVWDCILTLVSNKTTYIPFHSDQPTPFNNVFPCFVATKINFDISNERLSVMLNYIKTILADHNINLYKEILNWIAHPIRTLTQCDKILLFLGPISGKTILFEFLHKYVYGPQISEFINKLTPSLKKDVSSKLFMCLTCVTGSPPPSFKTSTVMCTNITLKKVTSPEFKDYKIIQNNNDYYDQEDYFSNVMNTCFRKDVGNIFYSFVRSPLFDEYILSIK